MLCVCKCLLRVGDCCVNVLVERVGDVSGNGFFEGGCYFFVCLLRVCCVCLEYVVCVCLLWVGGVCVCAC